MRVPASCRRHRRAGHSRRRLRRRRHARSRHFPAPERRAGSDRVAGRPPVRALIAAALAPLQIQLADAKDPYRPGESARVAAAPRAVYQAVLPTDPEGGQIVVYEFRDAGAAVDAGNELAGYLGTGAGRIQFPDDVRWTIRQVGTTLIFYTWAPSTSPDPGSPKVADGLATLGIGFTPPR